MLYERPLCVLVRAAGVARVTPRSSSITESEVKALGEIVAKRCPVAAMVHASGCRVEIDWLREAP